MHIRTIPSLFALMIGLAACTTAQQDADSNESSEGTETAESLDLRAAPDDAVSYIISPSDGDVVTGPVTVRFGLEGMGVAPAGVQVENTGHHHLMVDVPGLPDLTQPLPSDANHIHFGGGQTQTVLDLAPGTHTLQLVLGNWAHTPHAPPVVSERITITVE